MCQSVADFVAKKCGFCAERRLWFSPRFSFSPIFYSHLRRFSLSRQFHLPPHRPLIGLGSGETEGRCLRNCGPDGRVLCRPNAVSDHVVRTKRFPTDIHSLKGRKRNSQARFAHRAHYLPPLNESYIVRT